MFPTKDHAETARLVAEYAVHQDGIDTVLVVNSCARGQAVQASDLDMALLVSGVFDEAALESDWETHLSGNSVLQAFCKRSRYSAIHLDFFDGQFTCSDWDDGGGPDDFEIEIGNRVAYAVPLDESGPSFKELQTKWLPYYDESLRKTRFNMACEACLYDLDFIPFYVRRGLFLQAFDRLYKAFREFLQAMFINHRIYPIAYNKWLEEQLGMIGKAELYQPLLSAISVSELNGDVLSEKAAKLREFLTQL